jgi:hypothetical protein
MDVGSVFALIVLSIVFFLGVDAIFIASFALATFGALAAIPTAVTAGVTITATSLGFLILIAQFILLTGWREILECVLSFRRLALLSLFLAQAMVCTTFLPWLFGGEIYIYPMRSDGPVSQLVPVGYSTANVTQVFYLAMSYCLAVFVSVRNQQGGFEPVFRKAILGLSALMIITGLLDLAGANAFLELFRNASYALAGDTSIGDTKRVVGAMPEASAFGYVCASLFSILLLMRKTIGPSLGWAICCAGMGVFSILSTSSTAYGMMAATFAAFTVQVLIRLFLDGRVEQNRAAIELVFVIIGGILAVELALYIDKIGTQLYYLVNNLVLNKSSSSSFEERTRWTRIAFEAFVSSYGLGIGVGTARTSNGFVNVIASTGAAGAIFFAAFIIKLFVIKPKCATANESYATVLALFAPLFGLALSSTSPDFGPFTAVLFGLQSSRLAPARPKVVVQHAARGDPDDRRGRRSPGGREAARG